MSDDSVNRVLANVVKNQNGKDLLYQCHSKITNRRVVSQHVVNDNRLTVGDILNKRKQRLQMIYSVLVHK